MVTGSKYPLSPRWTGISSRGRVGGVVINFWFQMFKEQTFLFSRCVTTFYRLDTDLSTLGATRTWLPHTAEAGLS